MQYGKSPAASEGAFIEAGSDVALCLLAASLLTHFIRLPERGRRVSTDPLVPPPHLTSFPKSRILGPHERALDPYRGDYRPQLGGAGYGCTKLASPSGGAFCVGGGRSGQAPSRA